jgi:copper homeostasis protein
MMTKKLEICCFSLGDGLAAQAGGADRVELCANPSEGGVTPSYGLIKMARNLLGIKLYVIIRPRSGDFCYSETEWMVMQSDIMNCLDLDVDGISIGFLNENHTVNKKRLKEAVALAGSLKVVFHRAFDSCIDKVQALEDIIDCGCDAVMTSGGFASASDGTSYILETVQQASSRIKVIVAGGIRADNIRRIALETNADIMHSSLISPNSSNGIFGTSQRVFEKDVLELQYAMLGQLENV